MPFLKKNILLSTDIALFNGDAQVLLIKRKIAPFVGYWVLPGGHVEYGETVDDALRREVQEETAIKLDDTYLLGIYSDPERDPRGHTVSCAYYSKMDNFPSIELDKEADEYNFFDFDNLPEDIGFDHRQIIEDAYKKAFFK